jgi:DNA polymerase-1
MQTVTATGRLSSINPNLQNIPQKRESAEKMRSSFVPSAGYDYLLSADYSQIEMRVMADMSSDENLISAFNSGEDLHKYIASKVYNVPLQQVTPQMRSNAKGVSYGLAYGLSVYGLSQNLHIPIQDANMILQNYLARFSGVNRFLNSLVQKATETGYTETKFGRRRYIPTLMSDNHALREAARRAALNAPIQGTAADIMKIAMLNVNNALTENNFKSRILLQIHDELILEVTSDELETVKQLTLNKMQTAAQLLVPLDVSVGYGKNWHEAAH